MNKLDNVKVSEHDLFPVPEELFEEEGHYPSDAALEYLKNWCSYSVNNADGTSELKFGQYFGDMEKTMLLLSFIKELWWYPDMGINYENGKLELHTLGWSGNESIINILRNSSLWLIYWRKTHAGGHYYFDITRDGKEEEHNEDAYNEACKWFGLGLRAQSENKVSEFKPAKENFKLLKDESNITE